MEKLSSFFNTKRLLRSQQQFLQTHFRRFAHHLLFRGIDFDREDIAAHAGNLVDIFRRLLVTLVFL